MSAGVDRTAARLPKDLTGLGFVYKSDASWTSSGPMMEKPPILGEGECGLGGGVLGPELSSKVGGSEEARAGRVGE